MSVDLGRMASHLPLYRDVALADLWGPVKQGNSWRTPEHPRVFHLELYAAKGSRKNNSPFSTAGLERVVPGGQGFELLQRQRVHVCRRDLDALHIGSANQVSTNSESG